MKKYKARLGATFGNKDAQIYGKCLEEIQKEKGPLTPEVVVRKAKAKKSPIHSYFEWDNDKASEKYRLHQARMLMNTIEIEIVSEEGEESTVRNFFNVVISDETKERAYISIEEVMSSEEYSGQIIEKALKEYDAWEARYNQYKELRGIFLAAEEVKAKRKKARRRRKKVPTLLSPTLVPA